jgi:ATP-binding protein involved in chromosome partitioning
MIAKRLRGVKMILLVLSGKGGVGKSVVSAVLAALLEETGLAIGLLDADIYGPSSALLFGTSDRPTEGKDGLIPPVARRVKIMSVDLFAPGKPIPLTGVGARDVLSEMLALTHWGSLDYLVIDMPPATADIMMLLTSLRMSKLTSFVVTTPDRMSLAVAHRVLQLLDSGMIPIKGVIGNMHRPHGASGIKNDDGPVRLAEEFEVPFLGKLPFDMEVLSAVEEGGVEGLLATSFADALRRLVKDHQGPPASET